jgi:HAD superfamily hydrolase (TIGR01450 family)
MPAPRLVDAHDLLVLDLDGVVYLGPVAVPGAEAALRGVRAEGHPVAFATNNASRSAEAVAAHLRALGVQAEAAEVATAAEAAAGLLREELPPGSTVLVIGSPALAAEVRAVGLTPVSRTELGAGSAPVRPAAVVQGYDPGIGWADLAAAAYAVAAGALWVATNLDTTLPTAQGLAPGNGALVGAVAAAVGRPPDRSAGKPAGGLLRLAADRVRARRPLLVGDRLDTDIEAATRAGWPSLLVLTGVTDAADLAAAPPARRPDHVGADLGALLDPPVAAQWDPAIARWQCGPWSGWVEGGQVRLERRVAAGAGRGADWLAGVRAACAAAWSTGAEPAEVPGEVWQLLGGTRAPAEAPAAPA